MLPQVTQTIDKSGTRRWKFRASDKARWQRVDAWWAKLQVRKQMVHLVIDGQIVEQKKQQFKTTNPRQRLLPAVRQRSTE